MSDVALTLDAVADFLRRFVVLTNTQTNALALWSFHTWALEAADVTPYVLVSSAEKRSGKTRLLEVLSLLVRSPLASANISDAALFRAIEERSPTLLFDEIDSIFGPKARDREDLRGLLNAGYRRGTPALRMGGAKMTELLEFTTFCPKALAGIGRVPDTIADRAIAIVLKRRKASEAIDRFRHREAEELAEPLRQSLKAHASYHVRTLEESRPELPESLGDRARDSWEPLLAIADLAGEEWSNRARIAAVELSADKDVEDDTIAVRLLADIRAAFAANGDRLPTVELVRALKDDDEAPWTDWHGSGLSPRRLAELVHRYGIRSRTIRFEDGTRAKGYLLEQFEDAFERYLASVSSASSGDNVTSRMDTAIAADFNPCQDPSRHVSENGANPHEESDGTLSRLEEAENERAVMQEAGELADEGLLVPLDIGTATFAELREHFGA
jgi:Protein of unknown function (DUF3631)